jgi:hypothetical protein
LRTPGFESLSNAYYALLVYQVKVDYPLIYLVEVVWLDA